MKPVTPLGCMRRIGRWLPLFIDTAPWDFGASDRLACVNPVGHRNERDYDKVSTGGGVVGYGDSKHPMVSRK